MPFSLLRNPCSGIPAPESLLPRSQKFTINFAQVPIRLLLIFGLSPLMVSCLSREVELASPTQKLHQSGQKELREKKQSHLSKLPNTQQPKLSKPDIVHVTGQSLSVNGTTQVPLGLFGVHATRLDQKRQQQWGIESVRVIQFQPKGKPLIPGHHQNVPKGVKMIVECFYDRYRPALMLSNPSQWQQILTNLGLSYGSASLSTGQTHYVEFWNEPYLNWANIPGVNYDGRFYDQSNAAEGARVRLRGQQQFTEHLVWRRGLWVLRADNNQPDYVAARYRPKGVGVGQTYQWGNRTYRVIETWLARDKTQSHWFSGQQNRIFYEQMLRVFGSALKRANPDVQLIGGWGFHIHQDGWEGWRQLYKPLIDNFHHLLDGLNEHHYGGDTRMVTADYETVTAYTDRTYGLRLPFYNTEAGGMLDPERPDSILPRPEGSPLRRSLGAMTYTLRDIVHMIDIAPDKAVARAAHEAHHNGGDEYAFRLLRPLRGRLVHCTSPRWDLWCVASRSDDQLTVVLFNDARSEVEFPLQIDAPMSTHFLGSRRLSVRPRSDKQGLEMVTMTLSASGDRFSGSITLPSKSGTTLVFDLKVSGDGGSTVTLTQHFASGILKKILPQEPQEFSVFLPAEELARSDRARLKVVLPNYQGQGTVDINGTTVALEKGQWTVRQDIDPAWLQPHTKLTFRANEQGYGLWMVSIELINTDSNQ